MLIFTAICAFAAQPGDVRHVQNFSTCASSTCDNNTCFDVTLPALPVTMCRLDDNGCSIPQRVATELTVQTDPVTTCRTYSWTWTCARDYRLCVNGHVCVCSNVTTAPFSDCGVCNDNNTFFYNGTMPCTPAPTASPTAPTALPTTPPTASPNPTYAPTTGNVEKYNDTKHIPWYESTAFIVAVSVAGGLAVLACFAALKRAKKRGSYRTGHANPIYTA